MIHPTLARLWVFYGGETTPFCLSLRDNGTGEFHGGFVQHNPVRWHYDVGTRRLDLSLAHLTADNLFVLKDNLQRGYLAALDTLTGTLSYVINPEKPALNIFNWVLTPAESLADWERPYAAKGCPLLDTAGGA